MSNLGIRGLENISKNKIYRKKNFFRKSFDFSKKFRKKNSTSKLIFLLRSKKNSLRRWRSSLRSKKINFEVEIIKNKEFFIYNNISRSNRLRGIQKTWSRDHMLWKSLNNLFASYTLLKYLGPLSIKETIKTYGAPRVDQTDHGGFGTLGGTQKGL